MRSRLAKALRKRFHAALADAAPQFLPAPEVEMPPGWRVYRWEVAPFVTAYLTLAVHTKADEFTVRVVWTHGAPYPDFAEPMHPEEAPGREGYVSFSLSELREAGDEHWWVLAPSPLDAPELEAFLAHPELDRQAALALFEAHTAHVLALVRAGDIDPEPPLEEALARVPGCVDDAVGRITAELVPYLLGVGERYGYALPPVRTPRVPGCRCLEMESVEGAVVFPYIGSHLRIDGDEYVCDATGRRWRLEYPEDTPYPGSIPRLSPL